MRLEDYSSGWATIEPLLDEVLGLPAEERERWLDRLGATDAVLGETMRRVLAQESALATADFLGTLPVILPAEPTDPQTGALHPGATIAGYQLIAELGSGGMGAVWLAERTDRMPKRRVALKLPRLAWARDLDQRLERERDILAALEHPNIARLYDAGLDAHGRPYLALEYVDGEPIDAYAAARSLSLSARLPLLLQAAGALAHAHARLVLHRDVKPSNILVDRTGQVKLLDFGIAKLMQADVAFETQLTQVEGRALTPDYASPEQIRGAPIGTASDVYALGVVAYELLAGRRPYTLTRSASGRLVDALADMEAPIASRVATDPAAKRALSGDLDAILNKALKLDPAERYPTVDAFADDIRRHLRSEPVLAQPDRFGYRARKFASRHALQLGAAALVAIALIGGSVVALWQAREARLEATRADRVKAFALSIFEAADTGAGAGAATTAVDLLRSAQQRIDREFASEPRIAIELMTAVAASLSSQSAYQEGGDIAKRAMDAATSALGPGDRLTLSASLVYGQALMGQGRAHEALPVLNAVVEEAQRQGATKVLVSALGWKSTAQGVSGDLAAAFASAQAAVDALASGGEPVGKREQHGAWLALANAILQTNRPGLREAAGRSLALARDVDGDRLTQPVIIARSLLGAGLIRDGQIAEGLQTLADVVTDAEQVLGPNSITVAGLLARLAEQRAEAGELEGAIDAYRRAIALFEKMQGTQRPTGTYNRLALALAGAHRYEEAIVHFARAAEFAPKGTAAFEAFAASALSYRALMLARLGRLDEAERAFEALEGAPRPGRYEFIHSQNLAVLRGLQGRHDEAIALARRAAEGLEQAPSKLPRANAFATYGVILLAGGRPAEAVPQLERAVATYKQQIVVTPDHAEALSALARARAAAGAPVAEKVNR